MVLLGNVIWFVFLGGFLLWLGWVVAGCLMYLTVVGIPFGVACFRFAGVAAFPFGKEVVDARWLGESRIPGTTLANVLWFVVAGVWLALGHLSAALLCLASCLLILPIFLGAPAWALANLRLAMVALAPLGKRVVTSREAAEVRIARSRALAATN
ncbi:MAG TPA: YccF domain-containing protein [Polyangiaceae bacterium]